MPKNCVILGCISSGRTHDRKFFRFPQLQNVNSNTLAITQTRQHAWNAAINRSDFFPSSYNSARVCDLHFVSGKSAGFKDVNNVDWVPSLHLGYKVKVQSTDTATSDVELVDNKQDHIPVEFNAAESTNDKETQTDSAPKLSIGTQTEGTTTIKVSDICVSYEERIAYLEEMLASKNISLDSFRGQDRKTNFFTGITNFATLEALFEMFEPFLAYSRKLSKFEIMFIVLNRLRMNLSFRYMSYQFGVTIPTISKHFHKTLTLMHSKLRHFVYWPNRDAIRKTMPSAFQVQFGDTIVIVIDCFEVFIERPANLKAAAQCWSTYKHATTLKYLIGITPQGFIAFISTGFGGRCSDKFITETSGFMDKLLRGDVIMADRGFLIEEELKRRNVELRIPAFTKGKNHLHPIEIEETRHIANVRIHVERIIGQLRLKFTILKMQGTDL